VFQCGKCRKKFGSLSVFFSHKQAQCDVIETTPSSPSDVPSTVASMSTLSSVPLSMSSVPSAGVTNTNVIYRADGASPHSNRQQITVTHCVFSCHISVTSPTDT